MAGGFQKGGGGGAQQGESTSESQLIAVVILFIIVCVVAWTVFRPQIVYTVLALEWVQVKIVEAVKGLGPVGSGVLGRIRDIFGGYQEAGLMKRDELYFVMDSVGMQTAYAIVAMMVAMGVWVYLRMHGEGLREQYTLSSFMALQAKHWKVVFPGSIFDPEVDDRTTAPALRPLEWLVNEGVSLKKQSNGKGVLDDERAAAAFAKQLGETYMGYEKLPVFAKALAVLCVLHSRRDKRAQKLREDLATIWAIRRDAQHLPLLQTVVSMLLLPMPSKRKAYVTAAVDDLRKSDRAASEAKTLDLIKPIVAKDPGIPKSFHEIAGRFSYVNTAFQGVLEQSRKAGGVLANAEFTWLKPLDRNLWYAMHSPGRTAFFIEGAGSRSHYYAERIAGMGKIEPYVGEAIEGLKAYLDKQQINDLDDYLKQQKKPER